MCGICGFTNAHETDQDILKAMCDIMAHRGPDGEGQYLHDGIALGHRRLSLVDLANGNQPMVRANDNHTSTISSPAELLTKLPAGLPTDTNLDTPCSSQACAQRGDFVIVFNGEIYNYQDLRAELVQLGWEFSTHSDTEVLLVSYLQWGKNMLKRLRGMFAFALWNAREHELFCARDFFGIKPFYYTQQQGQFIFASEIKSILEHPAYHRELNREALEQYLCFQFSALPETFFKGVFKLPPAHCLTVHANGTLEIERFWQPEFCANNTRTEAETVDAIDTAMRESVRYHNVADVEVGSFLSSGIDSSYMAACLAKENPAIKTFTVGFAEYEGERDEISWAKELADELHVANTSHHITEPEYWESLARVQWHMDEPCADPSAVALYFVDKLAATQVKAVLSGEGADEFFGGYKIYQTPFANAHVSGVPKPLLRAAGKAAGALHLRGANYLNRASHTVKDWYYTNANGVAFSPEERAALLKDPVVSGSPQSLTAETYEKAAAQNLDETTRMQYLDLHFWLVGDILLKTDKMSMAHSLESRVPFLDRGVFDLARTIPTSLKANEHQTKIALRQAAEQAIPPAWAQKEKLGFPVPVVNWLREDNYYQLVKEWFSGAEAQLFFNVDKLLQLLEEHRAGKDNSRKIWICFMFLMWYRIFFVQQEEPKQPSQPSQSGQEGQEKPSQKKL